MDETEMRTAAEADEEKEDETESSNESERSHKKGKVLDEILNPKKRRKKVDTLGTALGVLPPPPADIYVPSSLEVS
jgi:hypothetical protein